MAYKKAPPKVSGKSFRTADSFQNFIAHVGQGTGNQNDGARYGFNPVTRNRLQMEWVYRGSWIAGQAVDCVAEDMTREGIEINTSVKPDEIQEFDKDVATLRVWDQLSETIKWSRLYGGSVAFMMIDGQNESTPLRLETIRKDQFKGLLPLDRWMLNPSLSDLVSDYGPYFGKPKYYTTTPDAMGMPRMKIHYSRVIRMEGVLLPYWQRTTENLWGQSIVERLWDRLVAFDSTTTGAAQMVYKAHLRTYKVEGLRDIIAAGGKAYAGLLKQIEMIRIFQSNEGITLMDAKDEFETHQYAFAGLDALLMQFGQQLSGALGIPLVRLFGQSPGGLNSTGESDLRTYYDNIKRQQVSSIGPGLEKLYRVMFISKFGSPPPDKFELNFVPLWQLSAKEKSENADRNTKAITTAYEAQIIKRATALRELKEQSRETGLFTSIQEDEINEAENDQTPSPEALGLEIPKPAVAPGAQGAGKPKAAKPGLRAVS
jgi:phage-related protein (TIGR01555 family)